MIGDVGLDKFQGHGHQIYTANPSGTAGNRAPVNTEFDNNGINLWALTGNVINPGIANPISINAYGPSRHGTETNPAFISVFITITY